MLKSLLMENCIFCKIIKGELPSYKLWEDESYLAFLSIFPIKEGHTLVIPKTHLDYFFDLEDQVLSELMVASKKVSLILKNALEPKTGKVGVMIAGLQVPHAHVHLIPMDNEAQLNFAKAHSETKETLQETLKKITAS